MYPFFEMWATTSWWYDCSSTILSPASLSSLVIQVKPFYPVQHYSSSPVHFHLFIPICSSIHIYIVTQATTPLSLFLNTSESSVTPIQRSVTPLLFPEHRLHTPRCIPNSYLLIAIAQFCFQKMVLFPS